jgi:hypothetical protein
MPRAKSVDEYVAGLDPQQAKVVNLLRAIVRKSAPGASESIKWSQPVFELNGPVCWIKANKAHVSFGFWRGRALKSARGLIESSGSKMGHIKLRGKDDIQVPLFLRIVKEAVRLNRTLGNPARG